MGDQQPHAREAALSLLRTSMRLEATEELMRKGLALAVAYLQAQQFAVAVTVDPHSGDNGPGPRGRRTLIRPPEIVQLVCRNEMAMSWNDACPRQSNVNRAR
jgi:hypothetical protein